MQTPLRRNFAKASLRKKRCRTANPDRVFLVEVHIYHGGFRHPYEVFHEYRAVCALVPDVEQPDLRFGKITVCIFEKGSIADLALQDVIFLWHSPFL